MLSIDPEEQTEGENYKLLVGLPATITPQSAIYLVSKTGIERKII